MTYTAPAEFTAPTGTEPLGQGFANIKTLADEVLAEFGKVATELNAAGNYVVVADAAARDALTPEEGTTAWVVTDGRAYHFSTGVWRTIEGSDATTAELPNSAPDASTPVDAYPIGTSYLVAASSQGYPGGDTSYGLLVTRRFGFVSSSQPDSRTWQWYYKAESHSDSISIYVRQWLPTPAAWSGWQPVTPHADEVLFRSFEGSDAFSQASVQARVYTNGILNNPSSGDPGDASGLTYDSDDKSLVVSDQAAGLYRVDGSFAFMESNLAGRLQGGYRRLEICRTRGAILEDFGFFEAEAEPPGRVTHLRSSAIVRLEPGDSVTQRIYVHDGTNAGTVQHYPGGHSFNMHRIGR